MVEKMPIIDETKCDRCGLCVSICKCGILVMKDNAVKVVRVDNCSHCTRWCNVCELVCPREAISCPFEIVLEDSSK